MATPSTGRSLLASSGKRFRIGWWRDARHAAWPPYRRRSGYAALLVCDVARRLLQITSSTIIPQLTQRQP
ncbi:MAG: hypothetical protein OEV27_07090 [Nitrospira sp.]|nr:hypothetical protein [Nitrospira sp.]MDH4250941.1 hypothetical protein [Nitrospira sp.]MDH4342880.1 hypothetical protein [Nitrospira sp.]MDH5336930.1 hypothetical protein [Nitrospira sp.]